ncbi:MAG: hypothetical protein QOH24_208 [Verrucomicrobiota bacterium]|jgi:hypothetical protein
MGRKKNALRRIQLARSVFCTRENIFVLVNGGTKNDAKRAIDKIGTRAESSVSGVAVTAGLSQKERQPLGLRLAG